MEFILKIKQVYTLADLERMDFVTYFQLLKEAETEAAEELKRMEANAAK